MLFDATVADVEARVKSPEIGDLRAVWPAAAHGQPGRAGLSCTVTAEGAVRSCTVVSEHPQGAGFGEAALVLSRTLAFTPAVKDGAPIEAHAAFEVYWEANDSHRADYSLATTLPWAEAPTQADVMAAYPRRALAKGLAGQALVRCSILPTGKLESCDLISEDPKFAGFYAAALSLSHKFRVLVGQTTSGVIDHTRVDLKVRFAPQTAGQVRYLDKVAFTTDLSDDAVMDAFPAKAAAAGLKTGLARLDCAVGPGGRLDPCTVVSESPAGMDFGLAAPAVAEKLAVNPWTDDGLPADGAHVRFAIGFTRREPAQAAARTP